MVYIIFCYWDAGKANVGKVEEDKKQEESGTVPVDIFQEKLNNSEIRTYDVVVYHDDR